MGMIAAPRDDDPISRRRDADEHSCATAPGSERIEPMPNGKHRQPAEASAASCSANSGRGLDGALRDTSRGEDGGETRGEAGGEDSGVISDGLFDARVTHVRHAPRHYRLDHGVWYLNVPIDAMHRLPRGISGHNRRALVSLHDTDYGQSGEAPRAWIERAFASVGAELAADHRIRLVTMPRVAGFAFNPVSFWFCHDTHGRLRAVLAEVNNTFGERHCYLCRHVDGAPIAAGQSMAARKVFHVSPFLAVDGEYRFRFHENDQRLGIFISLFRGGERILYTSITGTLSPLTTAALAWRVIRQPMPALRVLALIHFHAARLYLRGLRYHPKPEKPDTLVSLAPATTGQKSLPEQA
ncbi:MAG: DUF1365 domain-containing protein [Hyphomicrobiaceae bacterium]|nr:DUF1365 domain-containing protein [Hyphomicrobiaceae bacterium]